MTKICLLCDTHWGEQQDSEKLHQNMELFYTKALFPYLKKNRINKVIHLGDVFHNRKKIDMRTAEIARYAFFEPLRDNSIQMDIIAGNHDLYYRERSDTSSLNEIVDFYDNIQIFTRAGHGRFGYYIPWINKSNREETLEEISRQDGIDAFGHLNLVGFQMYRGSKALHGDEPGIFSNFRHVYTGHYHHKNTIGNVTYLGSTGQYTWADAGDERGFHIYDTDDASIEFVKNPFNFYEVLTYSDSAKATDYDVEGKHVRVYYDEIKKASHFESFMRDLEKMGPVKVSSAPTKSSTKLVGRDALQNTVPIEVETTPQLIRSVIEDDKVFSRVIDLYDKANRLK